MTLANGRLERIWGRNDEADIAHIVVRVFAYFAYTAVVIIGEVVQTELECQCFLYSECNLFTILVALRANLDVLYSMSAEVASPVSRKYFLMLRLVSVVIPASFILYTWTILPSSM